MIKKGTCLHLSTSGSKHLWIVLTDGIGDPPVVVMANLGTYRPNVDDTVVLDSGHSYIRHRSMIFYNRAKVYEVRKLEQIVATDITIKHREECCEELLNQIGDGILRSLHTPPKVKAFWRENVVL